MNNRIFELRKSREWTQDKFAEKMGISKNYVSLIENGKKFTSDRLISDICREFNVNENWLRTGEGKPSIERTRNQEIGDFASKVMDLPDKNIQNRLIAALMKLNERDWETIAKIANELKGED